MLAGIDLLELLTRGAAVGAFLALALVILRGPFTPARATGFLFCLSAAAHTLTQHPTLHAALGAAWGPLWVLSVTGAGLFWAFASELFEDRRRLTPGRFAPAALLLAICIVASFASGPLFDALRLAQNLISAALIVHVFVIIWTGWRHDLVESRRRLRGPILAAGALYTLGVTVVQVAEVFGLQAQALSPFAAGALLVLGLVGIGVLLRPDQDLFAPVLPEAATIETAPPAPAPSAVSADDERMADRLERLMRMERLYREESLSIGAVANKLAMPEYKLRRLINQRLGYRNFNAYLNQWRLADATEALSDPAQREVPISTIALDAGFQSLGPFNRAFKAETGLTPSEFRARALGATGPATSAASGAAPGAAA